VITVRNRARVAGLVAIITVVVAVAFSVPLFNAPTVGVSSRAAQAPASAVGQVAGRSLVRHDGLTHISRAVPEARPAAHVAPMSGLSHPPAVPPHPRMKRTNPTIRVGQRSRLLVTPWGLSSGSWLIHAPFRIVVSISGATQGARLQPQIEMQSVDRPFTGHPTLAQASVVSVVTANQAPIAAMVSVEGLRDGVTYHWRARAYDLGSGSMSAWTVAPGNIVRVHLTPPAAPALTLVTPALPGNWVSTRRFAVRWSRPADHAGIAGYAYLLTRDPRAQPVLVRSTIANRATFVAPKDGKWFVAVRALDRAGLWSPVARLKVEVDALSPRAQVLSVPGTAINPLHTPLVVRLALNQPSLVYISIQNNQGQTLRTVGTPLRGRGPLSLTWDGRDDKGAAIANGRDSLLINVRDRAGVVWTTTRPLLIEESAPAFTGTGLTQTGSYNPYDNSLDGTEEVTATLDTPAHLRVEAIRDGQTVRSWPWQAVAAGHAYTATWDGMDARGAMMPAGNYSFRLTARDDAENESTTTTAAVALDRRRIVISLNKQELWALDGDRVLLRTPVTTGGPELPTPTGDYQIIDRESPFTFHSPFPPSSPYWYADSPTTFALLFQSDGYFIHDAPWRSVFGPGSNQTDGTPGGNYTGTHGCVNTPYDAMSWLWSWATMYTPVHIRQDFNAPS